METVLLGTLGPEGYKGLWTGTTDWTGPQVTQALETFKRMLSYVNSDHSSLSWDQANALVIQGKAAMTIMGDWAYGDNKAIAVLKDGLLQQIGTPEQLYFQPENSFVGGFIGSPAMNFLPATLRGRAEAITLDVVSIQISLPGERAGRLAAHVGEEVLVRIRPEDIYAHGLIPRPMCERTRSARS